MFTMDIEKGKWTSPKPWPSQLPATKTLATLKLHKLPTKVRRMLPRLCEGDFLDRATNVLAFGLPGRGKTHVLCAIGHELVRQGRRVLFTSAYALVQRLLAAKRDYELERELRRLDGFAAVIIDDLGYVQQDRAEMEGVWIQHCAAALR